VTSVIYQERLARALAWVDGLGLAPGSRALDVGTGAGHAAVALAQRGFHVEAIDASAAMADLAGHNAARAGVSERVHSAAGNAQALTLPDSSVDLVVALGLLPWVPSPPAALAEMARVLRPAGFAIVSTANRDRLTYRLDPLYNQDLHVVKRPLRARLERLGWWPVAAPEPRLHSARDSDRLLRRAGLELLASVSFGFGPFTFLGRRLFSERTDVRLHQRLQRVPAVRHGGTEYLVLARRPS
jgi:SAM-dependent methyltransferase